MDAEQASGDWHFGHAGGIANFFLSAESTWCSRNRISPRKSELKCQPESAAESDDRRNVDDDPPQATAESQVVSASLRFPMIPPRLLRLDVSVRSHRPHCRSKPLQGLVRWRHRGFRHDRDRAATMSCERVASGAFHNQFAIPDGTSASPATNIHRSGLPIVRTAPMMATVATQAVRTSCFRWANVMNPY